MTTTSARTINVKGLGHEEKEGLILTGVESLGEGETLRIIVEFNPVPMVYMLKARGVFDVGYEKEGPDEWILRVTRNAPVPDKKAQFKELLTGLKEGGVSDSAKEKARALLQAVDAKTLGILEQELIQESVSHETIKKSLCDIHLDILRESLVAKRVEVSAPHPIHTFMEEHKIIVQVLHELTGLVDRLKGFNSFGEMGSDIEKLQDVSHHLVEAESHHTREEEALFPAIEKHNITEPPAIMRQDHLEFRPRKKQLYLLALRYEEYPFTEFKSKVIELGEFIARELESHIFKEDNILYQIALQELSTQEFDYMKRLCDKLGYCCFTPEDRTEGETKVVELDLRQIMPFERHGLILQRWDALKPGETLKITNDHDPKPLHYQFDAEYKGKFEWQYLQQGPKDWVVTIKRI
jgi:uncharacterized protein (DUF2249 family)/hemerythrin-like domain-containing protein